MLRLISKLWSYLAVFIKCMTYSSLSSDAQAFQGGKCTCWTPHFLIPSSTSPATTICTWNTSIFSGELHLPFIYLINYYHFSCNCSLATDIMAYLQSGAGVVEASMLVRRLDHTMQPLDLYACTSYYCNSCIHQPWCNTLTGDSTSNRAYNTDDKCPKEVQTQVKGRIFWRI